MKTHEPQHRAHLPLTIIPCQQRVEVSRLDRALEPAMRELILVYGLSVGRVLTVLQQKPMTVVATDELEIALEKQVAGHIWVSPFA